MNGFYVICNRTKDPELEITNQICEFLQKEKKEYCLQYIDELNEQPMEKDDSTLRDISLVLVVGGDGTLLQVARSILYFDVPVLGINCGALGFLTEVEKRNLKATLQKLVALPKEAFCEENRMMLAGQIYHKDEAFFREHALNDIVLTRNGVLTILEFDIYVNGKFLNHFSSDGVIVSTPTGSTGYNLSAGGPIVEPRAKLLMITPICPHTINTRSIILSADDQIEVRIPLGKDGKEQSIEVCFDGNCKDTLGTGDKVAITQSKKVTKFLKLNEVSFLEILHKKMSNN